MAAPEQAKIPSRSADTRLDDQQRRADDAIAGAAVRALALQRTLGNRATSEILGSWRSAGVLLQRALRGKRGVASARNGQLDEQRGRQILEEFSRNDPSSFPLLSGRGFGDVDPAENPYDAWMLDQQEWGLIRETSNSEVHLIKGDRYGVDWGEYLNEGVPVAHSHPWSTRRSIERPMGIEDLLTNYDAGLKVLPTISDFVFPARQQQTTHTVYTPYVIDANSGNVRNPERGDANTPGDANTRRLVWQLTEIQLDERNSLVTGRLTATSAGAQVWTRMVRASTTELRKADYTVTGS